MPYTLWVGHMMDSDLLRPGFCDNFGLKFSFLGVPTELSVLIDFTVYFHGLNLSLRKLVLQDLIGLERFLT